MAARNRRARGNPAFAEVGRFDPDAIVLSLGVDAGRTDENSPFEVTEAGFSAAGRRIGGLNRPVVAVQEGGYDLDTLGALVAAVLDGIEEGERVAALRALRNGLK